VTDTHLKRHTRNTVGGTFAGKTDPRLYPDNVYQCLCPLRPMNPLIRVWRGGSPRYTFHKMSPYSKRFSKKQFIRTRVSPAAYHEAGHAVTAVLLGMHVTVASVETKGFPPGWPLRGGVSASFDHHEAKSRKDAEIAATAGLAGEQSELLGSKEKPWRRAKNSRHGSFSGDRTYVNETLRPFMRDSSDKQRTIICLKAEARTLLAKHWNRVVDMATQLAVRKALNETEIERLVSGER
jgi:hypothetical protein